MKVTNLLIYICHFLSCWGNRMWYFGMGMFLVRIAGDTIQLSATFGLVSGLAVFFFGALVGDWIDHTPRLKAAQISLVLQDVLMLGCAVVVAGYLAFKDTIDPSNTWLLPLLQAVFVTLGVLSGLAAQARVIAVERDWIVEICGRDTDHLASMTAMLRRIDQVSMILAPVATGQVMTYIGLIYGAIFISVWNVVSVFVEFVLTWKIYNTVPALKAKKDSPRSQDIHTEAELETGLKPDATDINSSHSKEESFNGLSNGFEKVEQNSEAQCGGRLLYQMLTLYRGWRTYISYNVALAGLALAFLYMTVLDFHNITVAYAITQGLSESVVGILQGSSAVFGILGTFAYPVVRRCVGLTRTGFIALSCQVSCLTLCVVSIWMPGSPFDPFYTRSKLSLQACGLSNSSDLVTQTPLAPTGEPQGLINTTNANTSTTTTMDDCEMLTKRIPESYASVGFLMAGLFLARFGLWMADLTITQLFLEKVVPTQRGIVNGVQSSLNQLMDLLKYALVVLLPDTETFGFLIIVSFLSIATAWVLYSVFARREGVAVCVCGRDAARKERGEGEAREARAKPISRLGEGQGLGVRPDAGVKCHPDPQVGHYVDTGAAPCVKS